MPVEITTSNLYIGTTFLTSYVCIHYYLFHTQERWARREPQQHQPTKYLAIRKVRTCPAILKAEGKPPQKDCVLVIVGQHWCLAIDRDYTSLDAYMQHVEVLKQKGDYSSPAAVGGGPVFVDNLLDTGDKQGDYALRRRAAEDYLALEGSYGVLPGNLSSTQSTVFSSATAGNSSAASAGGMSSHFVVQRSTQPWLEGSALPFQDIVLHFDKDTGVLKGIFCGPPTAAGKISCSVDIIHCSYVLYVHCQYLYCKRGIVYCTIFTLFTFCTKHRLR